ncbi:HNH endonuclease signature motif containing protein [Cohnella hashimotonis]|uniref:HNH endonuclease signature motif containing protein n=1 Tax=Cohnella hashimotonis TaxID=2826895 RepID=A0ABT6TRW1_9BACL|nr:HNH endonuclease signature motif containing protein [Cohnella hashimotonis]MDI4649586.1 HNH endonuclease signature motif containing protein [Cohnella hashimotonis]
MRKKVRIEIPSDISAKVMFLSDRTCCVCRFGRKPVQIHHIDEDPANNSPENLAVLCLDCHNDTMIKGGFGRKLNADQVILYRNDWLQTIEKRRTNTQLEVVQEQAMRNDSNFIEYITSVVEIYREGGQFELLVGLYDSLGNYELRDKYIEIALAEDSSDQTICFLRGMQGRADLIPKEVVERETARYTKNKDYSQRARFYLNLGMDVAATKDYVQSVLEALEGDNPFSAAFYLKELVKENLINRLFEEALRKFTERDDLWWQIRALQELGWDSELNDLLIRNAKFIENSGNTMLQIHLAQARGDEEKHLQLRKEFARGIRKVVVGEVDDDVVETD